MGAAMASGPKVLLANEMGGGRGHVSGLRQMARALGPGVARLATLPSLHFAPELEAEGVPVLRAPPLWLTAAMRADKQLYGNTTFACYLAACGLADPHLVRRGLMFWRDLIVAEDVSVLIADYAPLALRAARGLQEEGWQIRILSSGTGFGAPPPDLPEFPPLVPDPGRLVHPERDTLAVVNAVSAELGLEPLPALPALFRADRVLAATFDFLDPYAAQRPAGQLVPPLVDRAEDLAAGDEVFFYFSRTEADQPALCESICALPLPRRAFLPRASDATRARLAAAGVTVESGPVSATALAARSRLVVHSAPHGTLCMAALAGLPQVGLPSHREQVMHGRSAAAAGVVRLIEAETPATPDILTAIITAYEDAALRRRARDLAAALRAGFPADPLADLAARLTPEIEIARGFETG
ncbi:hypothetical protein C5F44_16670 [Fuscovulum blasticum DSM 2131]|uniref:Glycosyltransferase n=2 Tax=Fuscovulum blasticum TaxID=1075 RepID=A0A2T4J4H8_FUSBL|nr:hypothetical protein C5F44_16670 [Fuscovulum blasticum DSM 2131]